MHPPPTHTHTSGFSPDAQFRLCEISDLNDWLFSHVRLKQDENNIGNSQSIFVEHSVQTPSQCYSLKKTAEDDHGLSLPYFLLCFSDLGPIKGEYVHLHHLERGLKQCYQKQSPRNASKLKGLFL